MHSKTITSTLLLVLLITLNMACKDDDGASISLKSCCNIPPLQAELGSAKAFLPNAFTPNGDGINDIFIVYGNDEIEKINSFAVFNGNSMIFHQTDLLPNSPSRGWDGRGSDNNLVADGVYTYKLKLTNNESETLEFEGEVCLRSGFPYSCVDLESQCVFGVQSDGNGGFDINLPTIETCE